MRHCSNTFQPKKKYHPFEVSVFYQSTLFVVVVAVVVVAAASTSAVVVVVVVVMVVVVVVADVLLLLFQNHKLNTLCRRDQNIELFSTCTAHTHTH